MDFCENPSKKKLGSFGAEEPSSSGPGKGLKKGACQMGLEARVCGGGKGECGEGKIIFVLTLFKLCSFDGGVFFPHLFFDCIFLFSFICCMW
jgi:hypothetical protein